ncbi:MAG TPA: hypothetical protein VM617_06150, partial [Thermoanaerobaculia bacterium]|nr:hypothetical protein [Thermoanaerobaculia bacterium]
TDRRRGITIASTERVFLALAAALPGHGRRVVEALWLGDTPGVYDDAGRPLASLSAAEAARLRPGGSAGTDVTGGMAHRLEGVLRLAGTGVVSTIADGRAAGLLHDFMVSGAAPGTRVGTA